MNQETINLTLDGEAIAVCTMRRQMLIFAPLVRNVIFVARAAGLEARIAGKDVSMFRIFALAAIALALVLPVQAQLNKDCIFYPELEDYGFDNVVLMLQFIRVNDNGEYEAFTNVFRPHPNKYGDWDWAFVGFNIATEGNTTVEVEQYELEREGPHGDYIYRDYVRPELCHWERYQYKGATISIPVDDIYDTFSPFLAVDEVSSFGSAEVSDE